MTASADGPANGNARDGNLPVEIPASRNSEQWKLTH